MHVLSLGEPSRDCSARGGAGRGEGEESGGERWAGNTTTGVRVSYTQEEGDINIYIYRKRGSF